MTDKKKKNKLLKSMNYDEELGLLTMSFNPIDVFKKSKDLKGDDEE